MNGPGNGSDAKLVVTSSILTDGGSFFATCKHMADRVNLTFSQRAAHFAHISRYQQNIDEAVFRSGLLFSVHHLSVWSCVKRLRASNAMSELAVHRFCRRAFLIIH
jgi:hypothetical protein